MLEKMSKDRVKGFLSAKGKILVNEDGDEVLLVGWGLGNWLLNEGYMWLNGPNHRFERPRRIKNVITELIGRDETERFFTEFRKNYVTREDIKRMSELGYNSVRIPINWTVLMEDEPERVIFKEDGFKLIDDCLSWCEEFRLYAILDLHGAPGGQTGANIDDSIDDMPRLFMDKASFNQGIALWEEIARRYKDRYIVGGYDLLNEPIRPEGADFPNCDHLVPELSRFYEEAIKAVRKIDKKHLFTLEGHHWSTDPAIFYKKYDDNMVIHFHRYWCVPDIDSYKTFLEVSDRLDVPLWLGETGENDNMWYTAMYPLSTALNIGYNVWPWKKMECTNSPYSIKKPANWDKFIGYTCGKERPSVEETKAILNEYLENMKLENCVENSMVTPAVFRKVPCTVRATDFDEFPGKGVSYRSNSDEQNMYGYRRGTNMRVVTKENDFSSIWEVCALDLQDGEFACYSINCVSDKDSVVLKLLPKKESLVNVYQDNKLLAELSFDKDDGFVFTRPLALSSKDESVVKIEVVSGEIVLDTIGFEK